VCTPSAPAIFAPDGTELAPGFTAEPVAIDISTIPAPAGLATFADGSIVVLDAPAKSPAGLFIVDPGATAIRPLIRLGPFRPADFEPGSFSLVTCFQTLEHVYDPLALCQSAFDRLHPGGALPRISHRKGRQWLALRDDGTRRRGYRGSCLGM